MTHTGTNTYLVGRGQVAVIDPGPQNISHLQKILGALEPGERITHILVTHSHLDHSPLAKTLSEKTDAPIFAFGQAHKGRSKTMNHLAMAPDIGGGEGIDTKFQPDICIADGERLESDNWAISALHTLDTLAIICVLFLVMSFSPVIT